MKFRPLWVWNFDLWYHDVSSFQFRIFRWIPIWFEVKICPILNYRWCLISTEQWQGFTQMLGERWCQTHSYQITWWSDKRSFQQRDHAHKVLRAGYYWPTLFRDAHARARKCKICQANACRERRPAFPLQPVTIENPFEQWGLDVDGEINPNSSKLHKYILTSTDYFSKCTKSIPLKVINDNEVMHFLQQNIVTRFGVPNYFVFDNEKYFSSLKIVEFALKYNINLKYSTNYYLQGNGVVKSTNKNLLWIIKKTVVENQRDWRTALDTALWVDRATPRNSLGTSPYFLVYDKDAILPPNIYLPSL